MTLRRKASFFYDPFSDPGVLWVAVGASQFGLISDVEKAPAGDVGAENRGVGIGRGEALPWPSGVVGGAD